MVPPRKIIGIVPIKIDNKIFVLTNNLKQVLKIELLI